MEPLTVQTLNDTGDGRCFAIRVVCPVHGEMMFAPVPEGHALAQGAARHHATCREPVPVDQALAADFAGFMANAIRGLDSKPTAALRRHPAKSRRRIGCAA